MSVIEMNKPCSEAGCDGDHIESYVCPEISAVAFVSSGPLYLIAWNGM